MKFKCYYHKIALVRAIDLNQVIESEKSAMEDYPSFQKCIRRTWLRWPPQGRSRAIGFHLRPPPKTHRARPLSVQLFPGHRVGK